MMFAQRKRLAVKSVCACFCFLVCSFAGAGQGAAQPPKFKIGYLEAGPFWLFKGTLDATKAALDKMGWQDKAEFPEDALCSPGWETEKKEELQTCARKLMARADLALIIAGRNRCHEGNPQGQ